MNNLSWFLYFADILPKLGSLAIFIAFFVGIATVVCGVSYVVGDCIERTPTRLRYFLNWSTSIFALSALISVVIPSGNTIYLIAGSEAGEFISSTPESQAIISDIREVIQLQLENLKTSTTKE